jgi:hypothetical protein
VDGAKYTSIGRPGTLITSQDLERVHGVAVWCLRSNVESKVGTLACPFCNQINLKTTVG